MQLIYFSSSKLAHKILKHRFMPSQIQRGTSLIVLPLPSERTGERLLRGCVQAFTGALVGIERCRFRWEMVSLSLSKGGEKSAETIVNIYQTTGVSLIKPFFIRKIFITLHRHLYVRCIAIEA